MRVLHIIQSLEFGGAEKVVVDLGNAMLAHHEVGICCTQRLGALAQKVDPRVQLLCLNSNRPGNDWHLPIRLARVIRDGGYDVVHSHSWNVYLESALATILAGRPRLIHTIHGNYIQYPSGFGSRAKIALRHLLERVFAGRHHRIVSVSDAIREYALSDVGLPADRVLTIHNGVACHPTRESSRDGKVFVTVGRLAAVKNHVMMIRAFHVVARTHPEARLLIAGDGPERSNLEGLVSNLGISDRVSFLGFQQDVGQVLAAADVFLVSSRYEGVSIAILEAMCAGLPVVATNVGGVPETIIDGITGILVPNDDESLMANAMLRLIDSPDERVCLGNAGRELLLKEFSIDTVVSRYLNCYQGTM
jgi:glycosyltransferase involved in cell wall biosynthesis